MSHIARIFVDADLVNGAQSVLETEHSHYLLRVMRLQTGAIVRAFNGRDGEWQCQLEVQGRSAMLTPIKQSRAQTPTSDLTLLFAPLKKSRTDFAVEKATELGVGRLLPTLTEYTQTARVRPDRLRFLAIQAAEQTERLDVPEIAAPRPLPKILDTWDPSCPLFFCDEAGVTLTDWQAPNATDHTRAGLLVGPEGGFSARERAYLRDLDFVVPITLGPRILRAETAIVSALTLWQSKLGDWHKPPYLPEDQIES